MRRNHLIWLGPLITLAGALSYFLFFYRFPALRDFPWVNLPLVLAGLSASGVALWRAFARPRAFRGKVLGSAGFLFSLALAALFGSYVFVLSYRLPAPTPQTLALTSAPELTLSDHAGRAVRLADFRGRKLVVVFYRGFW